MYFAGNILLVMVLEVSLEKSTFSAALIICLQYTFPLSYPVLSPQTLHSGNQTPNIPFLTYPDLILFDTTHFLICTMEITVSNLWDTQNTHKKSLIHSRTKIYVNYYTCPSNLIWLLKFNPHQLLGWVFLFGSNYMAPSLLFLQSDFTVFL